MKKFYTYILIITLCFSSIGCSKEEKKENENNNKAVVEEKDEKEINSGVSEEKKIDYSAYTGHWVNEKLLMRKGMSMEVYIQQQKIYHILHK